VKVAFDEHIPAALVRMFTGFAAERQFFRLTGGLEIKSAKEYAPTKDDDDYIRKSDAPWIRRFSEDGGRIIISGDSKMMSRPLERLALVQEGMIVIFFGQPWHGWRFFKKSSLLLHWWPKIMPMVASAPSPSFWRIPPSWSDDAEFESLPTTDKKLIRIQRQKAAQSEIAARRKRARELPPMPLFENHERAHERGK